MNKLTYEFAQGLHEDGHLEKAFEIMLELARSGDPRAIFNIAMWYRDGVGVERDYSLFLVWRNIYKGLAEKDNPCVQYEISQCYRFGDLFDLDLNEANYWLERAVESNEARAQHLMGTFYEFGLYNYEVNIELAERLYARALKQDNPETLYMFALRHFANGHPTDRAMHLLRRAADGGLLVAQDVIRRFNN